MNEYKRMGRKGVLCNRHLNAVCFLMGCSIVEKKFFFQILAFAPAPNF
jgi:hypothetical protein